MNVKYTKPVSDTPSIDSVAVVIDIETTLNEYEQEIVELYNELITLLEDAIQLQKFTNPNEKIILKFSFKTPEDPFTDYIDMIGSICKMDIISFSSDNEDVTDKAKRCYEIIQKLRSIIPKTILSIKSVCKEYKKIDTIYLINKHTWLLEILRDPSDSSDIAGDSV